MISKMYNAIERVLESLDVGGEQSRQFAEEIRILKDMIGRPITDELDELEKRTHIVERLRVLAVEAQGLTADLPTLPVAKWLDGTVANPEQEVNFEQHNLSALLQFIADVGVSYED